MSSTPTARVSVRAALVASGWVALAAALLLPGGSALRWVPVLAFVCFAPGLALLLPRPGGARLEAVALAAPLSLTSAVLAATSLFLLEAFSVGVFLGVLAAFTTVTALLPGVPLLGGTGLGGAAPPEVPGGRSR